MQNSSSKDSAESKPLRLLLVDDHAVMRAGLANMLNARPEFEVVAEADDGETALTLHKELCPDVTLLDVVMPGKTGIECLQQLKQDAPDTIVLMLSSSEAEHDMQRAMTLGANGYVMKSAMPTELISAILAVGSGAVIANDEVARRLAAYSKANRLTPRELEVLDLLRKGMSNPDIGNHLKITPRTAKAHVAAILAKLSANDRAEAVAKGFERGLLRP